jgi:hypothetical protein
MFSTNSSYDLNEVKDKIGSNIIITKNLFLNLDTTKFGSSFLNENEIHPFLILKEKGCELNTPYNDRIQCVKYMLSIPYKDNISHSLEVVKSIQNDVYTLYSSSTNIYTLYNFWSTQDPIYKLDDTIIYHMHPYFFYKGVDSYYPLDLMLQSCSYILSHYDSDIRQDILDYIVDLIEDKNATYRQKYDAASILIKHGEPDEIKFGKQIQEKLLSVEKDEKEHKAICKLRYLRLLYPILTSSLHKDKNKDEYRFENCSITIIKELLILHSPTFKFKDEEDIIELLNNTDTSIKEVESNLRISLEDEIKSVLIKRFIQVIYRLESIQKEAVIKSMYSEDKMDIEQFLDYYGIEIEECVYNLYKKEINKDSYILLYNEVLQNFINGFIQL